MKESHDPSGRPSRRIVTPSRVSSASNRNADLTRADPVAAANPPAVSPPRRGERGPLRGAPEEETRASVSVDRLEIRGSSIRSGVSRTSNLGRQRASFSPASARGHARTDPALVHESTDQVAPRPTPLVRDSLRRVRALRELLAASRRHGAQPLTTRRTARSGVEDPQLSRPHTEPSNGQRGRMRQTASTSPRRITTRESGRSRRNDSLAAQAGAAPRETLEASTADAEVGPRRDTRSFGVASARLDAAATAINTVEIGVRSATDSLETLLHMLESRPAEMGGRSTVPPRVEPQSPPDLRLAGSVSEPSSPPSAMVTHIGPLRVEPRSLRAMRLAGLVAVPNNASPSTSPSTMEARSTVPLRVQPHSLPVIRLAGPVAVPHNSRPIARPSTSPSTMGARVPLTFEPRSLPDRRLEGSVAVPLNVRSSAGPSISMIDASTSEPAVSSAVGESELGEMSAHSLASREPSPVNEQGAVTNESGAHMLRTRVGSDSPENGETSEVDVSRAGDISQGRSIHGDVHVTTICSEMSEANNRTSNGEGSAISERTVQRGTTVGFDRPASASGPRSIGQALTEQIPGGDDFTAGGEETRLSRQTRLQVLRLIIEGIPRERAEIGMGLTGLERTRDRSGLDPTYESRERLGSGEHEAAGDDTTISQGVRLRVMARVEQRVQNSIRERANNGTRRTEPERTSATSGSNATHESRGHPDRGDAARVDGLEASIEERTSLARLRMDIVRERLENATRRTGPERMSNTSGSNATHESRGHPDGGDAARVDGLEASIEETTSLARLRIDIVRERLENATRRTGPERMSNTSGLNATHESQGHPDGGDASRADELEAAVSDEGTTISQARLRLMARIEQRVQDMVRERVENVTRRTGPERTSDTAGLNTTSETRGRLDSDDASTSDELEATIDIINPERGRLMLEIANLRYQQQQCLSRLLRLQQEQIRARQRQVATLSDIVSSFGRTVEVARVLGQGEDSSFGRIRSHFLSTLRQTLSFLSSTLPVPADSTSPRTDSGLSTGSSVSQPNSGSSPLTSFGSGRSPRQAHADGVRAVLRYVEVDQGLIDAALRTLLRLATVAWAILGARSVQGRVDDSDASVTNFAGRRDAVRRCSVDTIASLPDVPRSEEGNPLGEGCVICLSGEATAEQTLCSLPCKHVFHRDCVSRWLRIQASCPTCRADVPDVDAGSTPVVSVSAP